MEVLGQSRVTFDYAHPQQSGVTVRCFEAQSLGVAVLTNNQEAVDCGLFAPEAIAHLPKHSDAAAVVTLVSSLSQQSPEPCCRSLDDFLDDLLSDDLLQASSTINIAGEIT